MSARAASRYNPDTPGRHLSVGVGRRVIGHIIERLKQRQCLVYGPDDRLFGIFASLDEGRRALLQADQAAEQGAIYG